MGWEMKMVSVGNGRIHEVPTTWAEGEDMITLAMDYHDGRGGNLAIQSACARIAFGLFGEKMMAADPTQALGFLMQRICQRKGAGLESREVSEDQGAR
jgi:hypothetical protein